MEIMELFKLVSYHDKEKILCEHYAVTRFVGLVNSSSCEFKIHFEKRSQQKGMSYQTFVFFPP